MFFLGGTFGTNVVTYTYTDGTASNPTDYTVSGTTLTFAPGERRKFISVQLKDDRLSEFQEWFRLDLSSIAGDGTLGALTRLNVTIETSDNPYGLFGIFNTSLSVFVENPNASRVISFPVYRKDGTLSSSQVYCLFHSCISNYALLLFLSCCSSCRIPVEHRNI